MQEDSWARPPGGYRDPTEMQAWMERRRLDKEGLTVAIATLCEAVIRDLDADLAIHREHVFPTPITLPVCRPPPALSAGPRLRLQPWGIAELTWAQATAWRRM